MFKEACKLYYSLLCHVGGGTDTLEGRLHGTGCMLSDNHALTANHVIEEMSRRYTWPVIAKYDGLFKCEIVHSSAEHDIALIHASEKIAPSRLSRPIRYPKLSEDTPTYGMTVGYYSILSKDDPGGRPTSHTFFSSASLSFFFNHNSSLKWGLSNGFGLPLFLVPVVMRVFHSYDPPPISGPLFMRILRCLTLGSIAGGQP